LPQWALVASNPFLGCLLGQLGDAAKAHLTLHQALDLTTLRGPQLEKRVAAALVPATQPEA
jgi:hypothetical protein